MRPRGCSDHAEETLRRPFSHNGMDVTFDAALVCNCASEVEDT